MSEEPLKNIGAGQIEESARSELIGEALKQLQERVKSELIQELARRIKEVEAFKAEAEERVKRYVECLIEAAKVALPVNVLDILAKGGYVASWTVDGGSSGLQRFEAPRFNYSSLAFPGLNTWDIALPGRKFRVTLVIERLE